MKLRFVPVLHNIRPRASSAGSGSVIARRGMRLGRPVHLAPCFVSRLLDCFGAKAPRYHGAEQPRLGIFKPALALLYVLATILTAHLSVAEAAAPGLQSFANHAPQHPLLRRTGGGCGWDYPCPPDPEFARPGQSPRPSHDPQQLWAGEHLLRRFAACRASSLRRSRILPRGSVPLWLRRLSLYRKMRAALLDAALQPGLLRPWLPVLPRSGARRGRGKGRVEGRRGMAAAQTGVDVREENGMRAAKLCAGLRSTGSSSSAAALLL